MKYVVTTQCVISGSVARVGDVVEPNAADIKVLKGLGYIDEHVAKEVPKTTNRAEALETSDEKPKTRGRKAKK